MPGDHPVGAEGLVAGVLIVGALGALAWAATTTLTTPVDDRTARSRGRR